MLVQLFTVDVGYFIASVFLVNNLANAYILRLPCLTYANFSIVKDEHVLAGYILEAFNNLSENECEDQCIQHRQCRSINTRNTTGLNCQLISKSIENPSDNVVLSPLSGWTYKTTDHNARNIGYWCAEKRPCHIEQVCIDTCTCPGYECQETQNGVLHNCQEAYNKGYKATTILSILIPGLDFVNVRCDMVTDGGGWIVFQRRVDASVDFYLGWEEYKNGFGDLNGNFWLGLEKIHKLTSPKKGALLRVDLKHARAPSTFRYAEYMKFEILSESEGYKLIVNGYSGNAGDSLSYHRNCMFSTKDRDQDSNSMQCAQIRNGAWWYNSCILSNLNALYPTKNEEHASYIGWRSLHENTHGGVIFSEMKLKYFTT